MKVKAEDFAVALKDSTEVEVSPDGKKIRRTGAKAVPTLLPKDGLKKREAKAAGKEEGKQEEDVEEEIVLDGRGNPIFATADFENP